MFEALSYAISQWLNGGNFVKKPHLSGMSLKPDYDIISTKQNVKKIFILSDISVDNEDLAFQDLIRDHMFQLHPNIHIIFNMSCVPASISVSDSKFIKQMNRAYSKYHEYENIFASQSEVDQKLGREYKLGGGASFSVNSKQLKELRAQYLSFDYTHQYLSQGGYMAQVTYFIEAVGSSRKELQRFAKDLEAFTHTMGMSIMEVKGNNRAYLLEFCPATPMPSIVHNCFLPKHLMSDENLAALSTYKSQGLASEIGPLFGMDERTHLPFTPDIFESPAAQINLIAGQSGWGKTYTAFQFAQSLASCGVHISAIDIKGREWIKLCGDFDYRLITFDEANPSFVNTLRLDDVAYDFAENFMIAVTGTVQLLALMINLQPNEGNISDLMGILQEAVQKLYSKHGVSPSNPASFANTVNLKYSDLLPVLQELSLSQSYTSYQKDLIALASLRCHMYVGPTGILSYAFQNEITLQEVKDAPFIIYELNKNQSTIANSLDAIRLFMITYLDSKKKAYLKTQGKYLACFYEELQRCDQFGTLLEYICADATGSRSNNVIIFLLLNSFKVLLQERTTDIRSNITSFFIGYLDIQDCELLDTTFGQHWLSTQCKLFLENPNKYRNCFATRMNTGSKIYELLIKAYFPSNKSEQYRTREVGI